MGAMIEIMQVSRLNRRLCHRTVVILLCLFFLPQNAYAKDMPIEKFPPLEQLEMDIFMNHGSIILFIDSDSGNIIFANTAAKEFYAYEDCTITDLNIADINLLSEEETALEIKKAKSELRNYFQFKHLLGNGEMKDVDVYSYPIVYNGQDILFSIIFDATEKRLAEDLLKEQAVTSKKNMLMTLYLSSVILISLLMFMIFVIKSNSKLRYISRHDQLTGVFNRKALREMYDKLMSNNKSDLSFIMLDVDNLKFINDTFGHLEGDIIIKSVANNLSNISNIENIVARVSGDEFVVLLPDGSDEIAEEYLRLFNSERLNIGALSFKASAGYLTVKSNKVTYDYAFSLAESRMYTNKAESKIKDSKLREEELLNLLYKIEGFSKEDEAKILTLADVIASKLDLSLAERSCLLEALKFQDIGLIIGDESIIERGNLPLKQEADIKTKHCEKGVAILKVLTKPSNTIQAVYCHHENYNGSGKPRGISGKDLPYTSRIMNIINYIIAKSKVDPTMTVDDLLEKLGKKSNILFDPDMIDKIIDHNLFTEIIAILKGEDDYEKD